MKISTHQHIGRSLPSVSSVPCHRRPLLSMTANVADNVRQPFIKSRLCDSPSHDIREKCSPTLPGYPVGVARRLHNENCVDSAQGGDVIRITFRVP